MTQIGRNDPCKCGSGKKYKKCCGAPGMGKRTAQVITSSGNSLLGRISQAGEAMRKAKENPTEESEKNLHITAINRRSLDASQISKNKISESSKEKD